MKKVILAFSGGLDTSFSVPYLKEQGFDVVTVTIDTGGFTKQELKESINQSKNLIKLIKKTIRKKFQSQGLKFL